MTLGSSLYTILIMLTAMCLASVTTRIHVQLTRARVIGFFVVLYLGFFGFFMVFAMNALPLQTLAQRVALFVIVLVTSVTLGILMGSIHEYNVQQRAEKQGEEGNMGGK